MGRAPANFLQIFTQTGKILVSFLRVSPLRLPHRHLLLWEVVYALPVTMGIGRVPYLPLWKQVVFTHLALFWVITPFLPCFYMD